MISMRVFVAVCGCLVVPGKNHVKAFTHPLVGLNRYGTRPITPTISTTKLLVASQEGELDDRLKSIINQVRMEVQEIFECTNIAFSSYFKNLEEITPQTIVEVCDVLDEMTTVGPTEPDLWVSKMPIELRTRALRSQRYAMLVRLMEKDYEAYVATASFLSPSRIPRMELPNVQDVPYDYNNETIEGKSSSAKQQLPPRSVQAKEDDILLVPDCELQDMTYNDSLLDKLLLSIFRKLVTENTGGVTSDKPGIEGLLEQGRTYMLQPGQTPENQHKMVRDTLKGLMTPVLPPFYRIFMSGIVPKQLGVKELEGKQFGPWFYAPFLTSIVTPTFFGFLVGPSYPNRRKDGQLGGLVVEKCKFLQESGCKGLCLHQCKLPAQQFFQDELGLPLTVTPNFVTQECQWSFGETPLPPTEDPSFPTGCLVGCESRQALVASGRANADACN